MQAHGFYSGFNPTAAGNLYRFKIEDSYYLKDNIQDMKPYINSTSGVNDLYRVHNLKRQTSVVVRTRSGADIDTGPYFLNADSSLVTLGTAKGNTLLPSVAVDCKYVPASYPPF